MSMDETWKLFVKAGSLLAAFKNDIIIFTVVVDVTACNILKIRDKLFHIYDSGIFDANKTRLQCELLIHVHTMGK